MSARILIVDDDPALLEALPEALAAAHGRDRRSTPAIRRRPRSTGSQQTDYDAIVTDIKMPGMDGLELLDEIQMRRPGHADRCSSPATASTTWPFRRCAAARTTSSRSRSTATTSSPRWSGRSTSAGSTATWSSNGSSWSGTHEFSSTSTAASSWSTTRASSATGTRRRSRSPASRQTSWSVAGRTRLSPAGTRSGPKCRSPRAGPGSTELRRRCRSTSTGASSGSRSRASKFEDGIVYAFRNLHRRACSRRAQRRLRGHGLARAAHAARGDLRRGADAPAPRRRTRRRDRERLLGVIATESERLTRIAGHPAWRAISTPGGSRSRRNDSTSRSW